MTRSVETWTGKTDDSAIPTRVRLRVWDRAGGRCQICNRKLGPADKWQVDHILALVNGGAHSEANMQVACDWCHKGKTAEDVAFKAKSARIRARHTGAKQKHAWPSQRLGHGNQQHTATRPIRRRSDRSNEAQ